MHKYMTIIYRNVCGGWKLSAPKVLGLLALRRGIHQHNRSPIHAWQLVSFTPQMASVVAHNNGRPFLHSVIGLHHIFVSYRWRILGVSGFMKIVPINLTTSFYEARACWLSSLVREMIPLASSPKPVPAVKAFVAVVGPCQGLSYVLKPHSTYSHLIDRPSSRNLVLSIEISIGIWPHDSAI